MSVQSKICKKIIGKWQIVDREKQEFKKFVKKECHEIL